MSLTEMLRMMEAEKSEENSKPAEVNQAATAERLKDLLAVFNQKHSFKAGDLVQYKPGMDSKRIPHGGVMIVVDVLETPVINTEQDSGMPYFMEPLDIVVGQISPKGGEFVCHHLDSRRLEPYTGKTGATI